MSVCLSVCVPVSVCLSALLCVGVRVRGRARARECGAVNLNWLFGRSDLISSSYPDGLDKVSFKEN